MTDDKGCAECTDWGNGNCASVGCPRWGTPIAYASGGYVGPRSLPEIEHPAPYVIPLGRWGYLVSLADEDDDDGYDEGEAHNARHPWWFPGCADCDERADAQDAAQ